MSLTSDIGYFWKPREQVQQWVIPFSFSPGVLGSPWLRIFNPQFNWGKGLLTGCSVPCLSNCLHSALSFQPISMVPLLEALVLSAVPEDLGEAFSKQ